MSGTDILLAVLVVVYGVVFGSFFNVCIYRIPIGLSVAKGNSFCPGCGEKIKWYDLVPVISFALLGGKCRHCRQPISPRYTVVELLTGILFLLCWLEYGFSFDFLLTVIVLCCLVITAFIDIEHMIIPDRFPVIILAAGVAHTVLNIIDGGSVWTYVIGFFAVSVPFLVIALLTGGIGMGDVKLMAAAGLFLGWKSLLVSLVVGSVAGAAVAAVMLIRKKAGRKTEIPFGPFLSLGIAVAALYGSEIITWYLGLMGI